MSQSMHLIDALHHFRRTHQNADAVLVKFCEVSPNTIRAWSHKRLPNGRILIKLIALLTELGYEIDSVRNVHETVRYLMKLYAFKVLSAAEIMQYLDLEAKEYYLWFVFRSETVPASIGSGTLTLEDLQHTYDGMLQSGVAALHADLGDMPPQALVESPPAPTEQPVGNESAPTAFVAYVSAELLRCLPLLKQLNPPDNQEVARQIRELMGSDNFFDLLDLLKGMSSREAGKFYTHHSK